MAININNNTVVRLIVRRGTDLERSYATFAEGEPAYTTDTRRFFIGDGNTGGVVMGNKFLGVVDIKESAQSLAQPGDFLFESASDQLWALDDNLVWQNISAAFPVPDTIAGVGFNYSSTASAANNLYPNSLNSIQLNSSYWSLCASGYYNKGRFFFGDAVGAPWDSTFARAVVDGPLHIDGYSSQIQLSAGGGCTLNFLNSGGAFGSTLVNSASTIIFRAQSTATSAAPSFIFDGDSISNGAVLIRSNLFVAGSSFFAYPPVWTATIVNTLTALSANTTGHSNLTALRLANFNTAGQATMVVVEGINGPIMVVNTTPWVGLHTTPAGGTNYSTYNTVISGRVLVDGLVTLSGGLTVVGNISATGDVIAFTSSDLALKDNVTPINGALDKLMALRGVEFDWNSKSYYSGHDVGVIAQEVEKIIPSAVQERGDSYKGVQYDKIIPLIIEAIRELKDKR
jgi:hypothetical protein